MSTEFDVQEATSKSSWLAVPISVDGADSLKQAANALVAAFESRASDLDKYKSEIQDMESRILMDAIRMKTREEKVQRREEDVDNIRKIAADRKAQIETLKQAVEVSDQARKRAESDLRIAKTEKERLEATVATLINEKRELQERLRALEGAR